MVEKELGHQGPTREAPPFPLGVGGESYLEGESYSPSLGRHPKGELSPLVAALSPPNPIYILEDFHPIVSQALEPPLVHLVQVLVGLIWQIRASPSYL